MIIREEAIQSNVKYWVKPDIENRIAEGSIKAFYNALVNEILDDAIVIDTPNGKVSIDNDYVLALTGYKPNFEFLRKIGIELSKDEKLYPQYDDNTMETNIENLYLAGVILSLIHI